MEQFFKELQELMKKHNVSDILPDTHESGLFITICYDKNKFINVSHILQDNKPKELPQEFSLHQAKKSYIIIKNEKTS